MIGPWASKDAEAFANALEGRGPRNSDVQGLVRFAESLCEAAVEPSPDFLVSLRAELMADASSVLVKTAKPVRQPPTAPVPHPVRRRLAAATAAVVASAGMVGLVSSSAHALPGDMLYSVKRSVESVQSQLHRGEASRGAFELSLATERLDEARTLVKKDDSRSEEFVTKSLEEFATKAEAGSQALFSDYQDAGNDDSINKVNTFAAESSMALSKLSDDLSPGAADAYQAAAAMVTDLASQASNLCSACEEAELSSLARAVEGIANELRATEAAMASQRNATSGSTKASSPPSSDGLSTMPPPSRATVPLPVPAIPSDGLSGGTDPLAGALLGDDDQTGLVPGLLDGLLGRK